MKHLVKCFIAIVALAAFCQSLPAHADAMATPPSCVVWGPACGQWDTWNADGGYILYNNVWGAEAPWQQCIWACNHGHFGVWADHPDTDGVKSYPNSEAPPPNVKVSEMASLTSTASCSVPSSGWNGTTSYDVWSGRKVEIMLWMNKFGHHEPWANAWDATGAPIPVASNLTVGGHTWNFYYNGGARGFHVYSFVRTSNTFSWTVDIKAVLDWLRTNTSTFGDPVIDKVQLGFEISGSPGGKNFTMNSYDVAFKSASTSAPAAPSNLAVAAASSTSLALSWTDNANNEDGFQIERSTDGTNFTQIATVGENATSYTNSSLTTGTKYYYRVRAYNTGGTSSYSNIASGIPVAVGNGTGLSGAYHNGANFESLVLTRTDATVNFNWGNGSPASGINVDAFSVRWTGTVQPLFSETYTFYARYDDGVRLWVNGQQLINDWKGGRAREKSGSLTLTAGTKYNIVLEYFENSGGALCELRWSSPSTTKEIIPQTQLYP